MSRQKLRSHEDLSGYIYSLDDYSSLFQATLNSKPNFTEITSNLIEEILSKLIISSRKGMEVIKIAKKFYKVYEDLHIQYQDLQGEKNYLEGEVNELCIKINAQAREIESKESRLETMSHESNEIEKDYKIINQEVQKLRKEIAALKKDDKKKVPISRNSTLKINFDSEEVKSLKENIEGFKLEIVRKNTEIDEFNSKLKEVVNAYNGEKSNAEKLKNMVGGMKKEILELKDLIDELEYEKNHQKEIIDQLNNEIIKQKNYTESIIKEYDRERRSSSVAFGSLSNDLMSFIEEENKKDREKERNSSEFSEKSIDDEKNDLILPKYKAKAPKMENLAELINEEDEFISDEEEKIVEIKPKLERKNTFFVLSSPVVNYERKFNFPDLNKSDLSISYQENFSIIQSRNSAKSTFDLSKLKKPRQIFTFDEDDDIGREKTPDSGLTSLNLTVHKLISIKDNSKTELFLAKNIKINKKKNLALSDSLSLTIENWKKRNLILQNLENFECKKVIKEKNDFSVQNEFISENILIGVTNSVNIPSTKQKITLFKPIQVGFKRLVTNSVQRSEQILCESTKKEKKDLSTQSVLISEHFSLETKEKIICHRTKQEILLFKSVPLNLKSINKKSIQINDQIVCDGIKKQTKDNTCQNDSVLEKLCIDNNESVKISPTTQKISIFQSPSIEIKALRKNKIQNIESIICERKKKAIKESWVQSIALTEKCSVKNSEPVMINPIKQEIVLFKSNILSLNITKRNELQSLEKIECQRKKILKKDCCQQKDSSFESFVIDKIDSVCVKSVRQDMKLFVPDKLIINISKKSEISHLEKIEIKPRKKHTQENSSQSFSALGDFCIEKLNNLKVSPKKQEILLYQTERLSIKSKINNQIASLDKIFCKKANKNFKDCSIQSNLSSERLFINEGQSLNIQAIKQELFLIKNQQFSINTKGKNQIQILENVECFGIKKIKNDFSAQQSPKIENYSTTNLENIECVGEKKIKTDFSAQQSPNCENFTTTNFENLKCARVKKMKNDFSSQQSPVFEEITITNLRNLECVGIKKTKIDFSSQQSPNIENFSTSNLGNLEFIGVKKMKSDFSSQQSQNCENFTITNFENLECVGIQKKKIDFSAQHSPKIEAFTIKNLDSISIETRRNDLKLFQSTSFAIVTTTKTEIQNLHSILCIKTEKNKADSSIQNSFSMENCDIEKTQHFNLESIKQEIILFNSEKKSINITRPNRIQYQGSIKCENIPKMKQDFSVQSYSNPQAFIIQRENFEIKSKKTELSLFKSKKLSVLTQRKNEIQHRESMECAKVVKEKLDFSVQNIISNGELFIGETQNYRFDGKKQEILLFTNEKIFLRPVYKNEVKVLENILCNKTTEKISCSVQIESISQNLVIEKLHLVNVSPKRQEISFSKGFSLNINKKNDLQTLEKIYCENKPKVVKDSSFQTNNFSDFCHIEKFENLIFLPIKQNLSLFKAKKQCISITNTNRIENLNTISCQNEKKFNSSAHDLKFANFDMIKGSSITIEQIKQNISFFKSNLLSKVLIKECKIQTLDLIFCNSTKNNNKADFSEQKKQDSDDFVIEKQELINANPQKKPESSIFISKMMNLKNNKQDLGIFFISALTFPSRINKNIEKIKKFSLITNGFSYIPALDIKNFMNHTDMVFDKFKRNTQNFANSAPVERDSIKDFFVLICQAIKLNSRSKDSIGKIPVDELYRKVIQENIPFNLWDTYVKDYLSSKIGRKFLF